MTPHAICCKPICCRPSIRVATCMSAGKCTPCWVSPVAAQWQRPSVWHAVFLQRPTMHMAM